MGAWMRNSVANYFVALNSFRDYISARSLYNRLFERLSLASRAHIADSGVWLRGSLLRCTRCAAYRSKESRYAPITTTADLTL